ncbi:hypothetical protein [Streptomyces sp. ISL-94]|uniref:hypothetical protein n=1 Tax=Streptomyces sp. ISL-94 TaxID=2819190 RepID=UPI001BEB7B41|nr:hypothetical protein [Streptomyces sp. ISL-94]MBT2480163.1 hypothetical protein [Streptomyces sp. ISL-94]
MPGPAARLAALRWALLIAGTPAAGAWARARAVGTADGPADVALAVGLRLRSRYRREGGERREP